MGKILILPDIHGRQFWKKPCLEYKDEYQQIIFLGDYLDPYAYEGITKACAFDNFVEIINFAKENKEKVILLLGNHDLPYINTYFLQMANGGRHDYKNEKKISRVFFSNIETFKLAFEKKINGTTYLFSHAGVLKSWYDHHKEIIGDLTVENLNKLSSTQDGIKTLCDISYLRMGEHEYGSMVWADVREHTMFNQSLEGTYQIFGHTQQMADPIIEKDFACLDCRKAFVLDDETGTIAEFE